MALFGKFVQTKSTNCFVILVASWGGITKGYSFVDQADLLLFVLHKCFFSGCIKVVNGSFGVVAFKILLASPDDLEPGSEKGVFEIFVG